MNTRLLSIALFWSALCVFGQTGQGTLTGIVTDPAGAVVPNATITAVHVETGTTVSAASSDTGLYTIPQLRVGQYEVSVTQPGFKTFKRDGITLSSTQVLRLDVGLEVGQATESVTVTAEASLLKTESGALTSNIKPSEIQQIPVLTVGTFVRDPFQLALTMPGVVGQGAAFSPRVNGLTTTANQYRLEGEVLENKGAQTITTRIQPSPDAIQELAVQSSNFNAEFGSVSGALFNITLKSGTNQIHGTGYDYIVNEFFNAADRAQKANPDAAIKKSRQRRHDYGFNVGGPIYIPKIYDGRNKSFFFFNWEQYRDKQVNAAGQPPPAVPTQQYRDGDFSGLFGALNNANLRMANGTDYIDPLGNPIRLGTIFDPTTTRTVSCTVTGPSCPFVGAQVQYRDPYPGNRIPSTQFDRVALAIQSKYIPLPNVTGGLVNNYLNSFVSTRITSSPAFKIDHNFSKARVAFTYTNNKTESPIQALGGLERGLGEPISANAGTFESGPAYRLNYDHSLAPTTLLHLGFGYSRFSFASYGQTLNYDAEKEIGLRGATAIRSFPQFASSVVTTPALGGMDAMGPNPGTSTPENRPSASASITHVRGNHTYKAGGDWRQDMLGSNNFANTTGNYNPAPPGGATNGFTQNGITWQPALQGVAGFSGVTQVGFGYANFLLGSVRTFTLGAPVNYRRQKTQMGFYVQDTWRAKRNLTIDYGLRWDYGTYSREDYGRLSTLNLNTPNPAASGRLGGQIFEATCNCKFAQNYPYAIGPRIGVAYTITPKTVLRGGFGVTYGSTSVVNGGLGSSSVSLPDQADGQNGFFLRDGVPSSIQPVWPVFSANAGQIVGSVVGAPPLTDRNAGRPERVFQWNISLQREIARNLVVEASYAANRAAWLGGTTMQDYNAISEATLNKFGFRVGNVADADLLNSLWSQVLANPTQLATLAQRGVGLPYANFPTNQTVLQSLRAMPQYNSVINPTNAPMGRSWYDSLQLQMNKRFSRGLQANVNYTWAKNLQFINTPDVFNRSFGKDVATGANFNPPHVLRISATYEVQKPSDTMPVLGNKVVSHIVRGWGISAALFYQSAGYLGRPLAGSQNGINRWLGRGPGGAMLKQNADGSYMNPWSVNWVDNSGTQRTDPIDINCKCFDPEKTIVLNPNAWQAVPDGVWSPQQQQITSFRASRRPSEAMNFARTFRLKERFSLQVRAEFQNVFNRTFLPNPQIAGLNFTAAPTLQGGRYTAGFGTFGNLRAANAFGTQGGGRSGLFIARFNF